MPYHPSWHLHQESVWENWNYGAIIIRLFLFCKSLTWTIIWLPSFSQQLHNNPAVTNLHLNIINSWPVLFCVGQQCSVLVLGHTDRTLTHGEQCARPAWPSGCAAMRLQGLVPIVLTVPVTRYSVKTQPGCTVRAQLLSSGYHGEEERGCWK